MDPIRALVDLDGPLHEIDALGVVNAINSQRNRARIDIARRHYARGNCESRNAICRINRASVVDAANRDLCRHHGAVWNGASEGNFDGASVVVRQGRRTRLAKRNRGRRRNAAKLKAAHGRRIREVAVHKVLADAGIRRARVLCRRVRAKRVVASSHVRELCVARLAMRADLLARCLDRHAVVGIEQAVVHVRRMMQLYVGIAAHRGIASDNAVDHRQLAAVVATNAQRAAFGSPPFDAGNILHDRGVANSHGASEILQLHADACALARAPGISSPVPADQAGVDRDRARVIAIHADAAALAAVAVVGVEGNKRVVDRTLLDEHATAVGALARNSVVADAAPGNRAALDIQTAAMIPVRRNFSASHGDTLNRRVARNRRNTPRTNLLDDGSLPALTRKRDAVRDHQLGVDVERTAAERDCSMRWRSGVDERLNSRNVVCASRVVARRKRTFRIDMRLGVRRGTAASLGKDDVLRLRCERRIESRRVATSAVRRCRCRLDYRVDSSYGLISRVRGIGGASRACSASRVVGRPDIGRRAPGVGVRCRRVDNRIAARAAARGASEFVAAHRRRIRKVVTRNILADAGVSRACRLSGRVGGDRVVTRRGVRELRVPGFAVRSDLVGGIVKEAVVNAASVCEVHV